MTRDVTSPYNECMSLVKLAIIVKQPDGYHVYSEDRSKHLGGPYKSKREAYIRLAQVEYWKNRRRKQSGGG